MGNWWWRVAHIEQLPEALPRFDRVYSWPPRRRCKSATSLVPIGALVRDGDRNCGCMAGCAGAAC